LHRLYLRYLLISASVYFFYNGVTYFFSRFLPISMAIFGGTLISLIIHFYMNVSYTFSVKLIKRSIVIKYLSVALLNYFIQIFIYKLISSYLSIGILLPLLISSAAISILGFLLSKYWIFKDT
jgi:putative flippase GtrA